MEDDDAKIPPREVMDIAACTCANLRKATRVVTQAYDAALRPSGLKATQFTLLSTLEISGPVPLTQLAAALVMDRTTLTRNLKPLVGKGLIRIESAADQRVRQVVLTEAGKQAMAAARPHWRRVQARLSERLGIARWSGLIDDLAAAVATVPKP